MIIGIFSDVHDHIDNLNKALQYFKEKSVQHLIFCGDFCSPIPITKFAKFPEKIHAVFGNNDGDRFAMQNKVLAESKNITLHGEYGNIELGAIKIAFTHYPFYGHALAKCGDYDLVCAGHTHKPEIVYYRSGVFMNPGDLLGLYDFPTIGLYDTNSRKGKIISLNDIS